MTDLVYPRWVHRQGKESRIAETPKEHAAIEAAWDAEAAPKASDEAAAPVASITGADLQRAWCEGVVAALKAGLDAGVDPAVIAKIQGEFEADVTAGFVVDAPALNALTEAPKARGGRPRKPASVAVN